MSEDKRQTDRVPIELKVEYKRLNTFFSDYTKNISKGGTFIKTKRPLDIGTEFVFQLHVPARTGLVKVAVSTNCWASSLPFKLICSGYALRDWT